MGYSVATKHFVPEVDVLGAIKMGKHMDLRNFANGSNVMAGQQS